MNVLHQIHKGMVTIISLFLNTFIYWQRPLLDILLSIIASVALIWEVA